MKMRECVYVCVLEVEWWGSNDLISYGSAQEAHSLGSLMGKRRDLNSFFVHCSSSMKRAASLNYLNQPSAAPLKVSRGLSASTMDLSSSS